MLPCLVPLTPQVLDPVTDLQGGPASSQNQPFIPVPVSRLSSLLRRFHRGRGWVPAHLDLDKADHFWLQQSLIIRYVEANYARAYKASRNRCCSLLGCLLHDENKVGPSDQFSSQ